MKRLKIGLVLDDTLDSTDGVQQYVLTLGKWLESVGHEVIFLCGQTSRRDVDVRALSRNLKVRFNGNRMTMPLPASRQKIKRLLRDEKFDVLHFQMPYSPWLSGRIISLAAKQKIALVGTFHILPHSNLARIGSRILAAWTRRTSRRLDKILAVSPAAADFAEQTFGLKCDVLPNVFDAEKFMSAHRQNQTNFKTLKILFLGRLVARKGCQYLLQAILEVSKNQNVPKFKLIIAGRGPDEAKLKSYVRENNLQKIVEFTGFIEEAAKPALLSGSDIAVFPSTGGESFGIILLEAFAASRGAVLAGNNPGYAGLMAAHDNQIFEPKNIQKFSAILAQFMVDSSLRSQAAAWQTKRAEEYDVNALGPKVVDIYQKALNKSAGVR